MLNADRLCDEYTEPGEKRHQRLRAAQSLRYRKTKKCGSISDSKNDDIFRTLSRAPDLPLDSCASQCRENCSSPDFKSQNCLAPSSISYVIHPGHSSRFCYERSSDLRQQSITFFIISLFSHRLAATQTIANSSYFTATRNMTKTRTSARARLPLLWPNAPAIACGKSFVSS